MPAHRTQPPSIGIHALFLLLAVASVPSAYAQPEESKAGAAKGDAAKATQPSVFEMPRLQRIRDIQQAGIVALMTKSEYGEAQRQLGEIIRRSPEDVLAHYNLACALARQGRVDASFKSLSRAIELGFRDRRHIENDGDLRRLRDDDRFTALLKSAERPPRSQRVAVKPAEPADGQVVIDQPHVAWDAAARTLRAFVKFEETPAKKPVVVGFGEAGDLVRRWYEEGTAAGNHGDLYDNHDSDHSNMKYAAFPQLTRVEFSAAAKQRGLHHGLQRFFLYNCATIGNSSTAITQGPYWRSQGRLALVQPGGPATLYRQYRANHLYFYPEHRDHDAASDNKGSGHGDVFPANTPYLILSQGSSGSDRAFMNAVALTLAAFRPEVKRVLREAGALMPAVQMIFRMSNRQVERPEDYLKGKAHPTVFDGKQLRVVKMVELAHALRSNALPPLVSLNVVEEELGQVGIDYFDTGARERLFDTPSAIARVVKSTSYERRMVVSAEASRDLADKPLTYHWVVLRGDADRIRINKRNAAGGVAELVIPYHDAQPNDTQPNDAQPNDTQPNDTQPNDRIRKSRRVDIGVFVHNGEHYSAPAFISFHYLAGETRVYDERKRIQVVDYRDPIAAKSYVDPLLDFRKDWRDEYHYAEDGKLAGWTRTRSDRTQQFTAGGRLILEAGGDGQPQVTASVRYIAKPRPQKAPVLTQQVVEEPPAP